LPNFFIAREPSIYQLGKLRKVHYSRGDNPKITWQEPVRPIIRACYKETAAKQTVAEQVARQRLAHEAARKGADAIMGYSERSTIRRRGTPFQDYAVVVTGIAIKKNH
jgi:uncharacterized protein YbjQ (UPF0145 family)